MHGTAIDPLKRLRDLVESDRFASHKRLPPERKLADELGVSRAVLRRALSILEEEGKIWRHVGRGTFIGSPAEASPEEVSRVSAATNPAEIMEARMILEPKLASLAALRATKNELAQMELYLKKSEEAIDTASFEKWDEILHWSIAQATDNSLLTSLFRVIQNIRESNIWGSLKEASLTNARRKIYCQQHCELVEALKDRNAVKVEGLMREHLEMVRKHLMEIQP
jgi:DNA-binding FadR family transcriptional regulator